MLAVAPPIIPTLTTTGISVVPLSRVDVGDTVQVAPAGAPEQLKLTVLLAPAQPAICRLYVADCHAVTVADKEPPVAVDQVRTGWLPTVMLIVATLLTVPLLAVKVKLSAPLKPEVGV